MMLKKKKKAFDCCYLMKTILRASRERRDSFRSVSEKDIWELSGINFIHFGMATFLLLMSRYTRTAHSMTVIPAALGSAGKSSLRG